MRRPSESPCRVLAVLLIAALVVSTFLWRGDRHVQAEIRGKKEQPHFQSGGARSETVLLEISATLKKMETRLERLEQIAQRIAEKD